MTTDDLMNEILELRAHVAALSASLQVQKDNRNRDLTAFKHTIHEKKELERHVAALSARNLELESALRWCQTHHGACTPENTKTEGASQPLRADKRRS